MGMFLQPERAGWSAPGHYHPVSIAKIIFLLVMISYPCSLGALTRRPLDLCSLVLENAVCTYFDEVRDPEFRKASVDERQGDQREG